MCRGLPAVRLLAGTSGVAPRLSTAADGAPGMYTAGTCAHGFRAFFGGSRLLYALDLGSATPLGGTLTLTTCGHSANNTVLYVGTGCPSWAQPFGCVAGNDNAGAGVGAGAGSGCGANPLASTLAVTVSQPMLYVQLGGYGGEPVVSGLGWSYAVGGVVTGSGSGTRSAMRSRSRSGSRSGSRSRSRKAK